MRLVLALLFAVACADVTPLSRFGTYHLRAIDGRAVPTQAGGMGTRFVSGTLALYPDSTYIDATVMQWGSQTVVDSVRGAFSRRGDSLDFAPAARYQPYTGALTANGLTVAWGEGTFTYTRGAPR